MMDRRAFLERCAAAGLTNTLLPGALAAIAVKSSSAQTSAAGSAGEQTVAGNAAAADLPAITSQMLDAAAAIAGITLSEEQKTMMLDGVREQRAGLQAIRDMHLPNSVAPAMVFDVAPESYKLPGRSASPLQHIASDLFGRTSGKTQLSTKPVVLSASNEERLALQHGTRTEQLCSVKEHDKRRSYKALPRAPEALRSAAQVRHQPDGGARSRASRTG